MISIDEQRIPLIFTITNNQVTWSRRTTATFSPHIEATQAQVDKWNAQFTGQVAGYKKGPNTKLVEFDGVKVNIKRVRAILLGEPYPPAKKPRVPRPTRKKDWSVTHGCTYTPTYKSWASMKARCNSDNAITRKSYKDRGITVCPEWQDSFEVFLDHIGERPTGSTLDRIDNCKGYFPGNVKWSTPKQQLRNQRRNRWITFNGETKILADWATHFNVTYSVLYGAIVTRKESPEKIFHALKNRFLDIRIT